MQLDLPVALKRDSEDLIRACAEGRRNDPGSAETRIKASVRIVAYESKVWQIALVAVLVHLFAVALTAPIGLAVVLVPPGLVFEELLGCAKIGRLLSLLSIGSSALFFGMLAVFYGA